MLFWPYLSFDLNNETFKNLDLSYKEADYLCMVCCSVGDNIYNTLLILVRGLKMGCLQCIREEIQNLFSYLKG